MNSKKENPRANEGSLNKRDRQNSNYLTEQRQLYCLRKSIVELTASSKLLSEALLRKMQ